MERQLGSLISGDDLFETGLCGLRMKWDILSNNVLHQLKVCTRNSKLGADYSQNTCRIACNITKTASRKFRLMHLMYMIAFVAFEVSISLKCLTNLLSITLNPKDFGAE